MNHTNLMNSHADTRPLLHASGIQPLTYETVDRGLSELHWWFENGRIRLCPELQGKQAWGVGRASRLIESFLLRIPVPAIYLSKAGDGKYDLLDGLQRLTSVFQFFENKFELEHLEVLKEFEGCFFEDLTERMKNRLEHAVVCSFELANASGMHSCLISRLNPASVKLKARNKQE